MKTLVKIAEVVLNAIMFIILGGLFVLFMLLGFCSTASAAEPEPTPEPTVLYSYDYVQHVQNEFTNAQFLTRIANKQIVNDYLWLIDHSIYEVSVETWNAFVKRYNVFKNAQRQYLQGWNIEFDDIL